MLSHQNTSEFKVKGLECPKQGWKAFQANLKATKLPLRPWLLDDSLAEDVRRSHNDRACDAANQMWPSLCQLRVARREESHRGEAGGVPSANLGRTLQESVGFPCLSRLLIAKNNAMVYDSMINYNVLKPTITTPTSPSRKNRGRQGGFWIGERFGFRKRGYARRA